MTKKKRPNARDVPKPAKANTELPVLFHPQQLTDEQGNVLVQRQMEFRLSG